MKEEIQDESGQGTTEYILMLVAAVAVALVFGGQLRTKMGEIINGPDGLTSKLNNFMSDMN